MKFDEWAVRKWLNSHPELAKRIVSDYSAKHHAQPGSTTQPFPATTPQNSPAVAFPIQQSEAKQSSPSIVQTIPTPLAVAASPLQHSIQAPTSPTSHFGNLLTLPSGNITQSAMMHHYELIFDIAKIVYSSLDLQTVIESVLSVAATLISAERCSVFLLDKATNQLYTLAFDIGNGAEGDNGISTLEQAISANHSRTSLVVSQNDENTSLVMEDVGMTERARHLADAANKNHKPNPGFRIPVGQGVAGYVAQTRVGLNIKDAYADKRFNPSVDKQTGFKTDSILCLPIFGPASEDGQPELVGVASLVNKITQSRRSSGNIASQSSIQENAQLANSKERSSPVTSPLVIAASQRNDTATKSPTNESATDYAQQQASQLSHHRPVFSDDDAILFKNLLVLVGIAIKNAKQYEETKRAQLSAADLAERNAELYETARLESEKAKIMLQMAGTLYKEENTKELVKKIIVIAKDLMRADKASFFIVDHEKGVLHSTVFDNETEGSFSVPINKGIAGCVASTGKLVNIEDAYNDSRFNPDVDVKTNYRTRSMLCVPVPGPNGNIVGVAYLINKLPPPDLSTDLTMSGRQMTSAKTSPRFTTADEQLFSSFSIYCGLALHKTMLLEQIENQRRRLSIIMELMSFHSIVREDEAEKQRQLVESKTVDIEQLRSISFDPHVFPQSDETLAAITYQMFIDLKFGERYIIPNEKLINYILTVRKNYRPVPYHNFTHAVSVTHAFYTFVVHGVFDDKFDHLEIFAMFVACLNHDIDHRGTNNQFQKQAQTELATFYSTSTMERHHFNHAMTILSHGTGLNILGHLNNDDYQTVLKVIEHSILATDLGLFFANKGKMSEMIQSGGFDGGKQDHRDLLRGLVMTCCDLGAMFKPWESSRKTADSVYEEFFQQGDEERRLGLRLSGELMDRAKISEIPRMQFDFYRFVVTPAYELLYGILGDRVKTQFDGVAANRARWKVLQDSGMKYDFGMDV